jgi:hypothetical protein
MTHEDIGRKREVLKKTIRVENKRTRERERERRRRRRRRRGK